MRLNTYDLFPLQSFNQAWYNRSIWCYRGLSHFRKASPGVFQVHPFARNIKTTLPKSLTTRLRARRQPKEFLGFSSFGTALILSLGLSVMKRYSRKKQHPKDIFIPASVYAREDLSYGEMIVYGILLRESEGYDYLNTNMRLLSYLANMSYHCLYRFLVYLEEKGLISIVRSLDNTTSIFFLEDI